MSENFRWEEILARTGDNLAASREILKDAGSVTHWSRKLREDVRRDRKARQEDREARQQEREARQEGREPQAAAPDMVSAAPDAVLVGPPDAGRQSGDFVLVVRLVRDLDLVESPQLLRLLQSLAAGEARRSYLEEQGLEKQQGFEEQGLERRTEGRSLALEACHVVVVDLRGVRVVDGSGLSCLIAGHQALIAMGLRLAVLLTPASQPARVFDRAGLEKIIFAFGSLDEL